VSGPRLSSADVYVLTSENTFSAAEEFSYNLKNLKRGTIVGDTSGGGAHPTSLFTWRNLHVTMSIPFGKAINPITDNWESTGVIPDIPLPYRQGVGCRASRGPEEDSRENHGRPSTIRA